MDIFDKLTLVRLNDMMEIALDNIENEIIMQRAMGEDRTELINNALAEAKDLQNQLHKELAKIKEEI